MLQLKIRSRRWLAAGMLALSLPIGTAMQAQRHGGFNDGVRQGGRGGSYNRGGYRDGGYRDGGYRDDGYQGHGVGAGRGALIGGGVGAAAGLLFGGGLKGALIGGGAGAGIGALAGHEHQQTMRRHYYERRDGYYPR